jgi:hypothetical protein
MSLKKHAKQELEFAGFFSEDSDYGGMLGKAVMELIDVFSEQGHSGMSASLTLKLFSKVANYESLSPLTGKDEEWDFTHDHWQNKRNSAVFKDKDGNVSYLNAIIKRCPNGVTWTGPLFLTREDALNNRNRVNAFAKGFPFTPKIFYVDVVEEEIEKDDWIMWAKDPKQLNEVAEYYRIEYYNKK